MNQAPLIPRPFGRTGLHITPLALGTVKFGRNQGLKHPVPFDLPDLAELANLLDVAHDGGINLLDTAPAYGLAEERLGELLARTPGRFQVATKVGEDFEQGQSRFDFSDAAVTASIERSLKHLRRDCLDMVFIHSDGVGEASGRFDTALAALDRAKHAGKLRLIGFSGKTLDGGRAVMDRCDALMVALNPSYRAELALISEARAKGRGILIKKALDSGHLVASNDQALQAAFDLCLAEAGADCVVVGTLSPKHLAADMAAARRAARY